MKINQLRQQLDELKKKEAIAQTKEQFLNDEKKLLLREVNQLLEVIKPLGIVSDSLCTPSNLSEITSEISRYIESEITKSNIPQELL